MKIKFVTFSISIDLNYLLDQVGREGVGYDPDFDSNASVVVAGEGEVMNYSNYSYHEYGNQKRLSEPVPSTRPADHWQPYQGHNLKEPYSLEVLRQGPSWTTAWSGYRYTLIESSPGRQVWEYQKAKRKARNESEPSPFGWIPLSSRAA